jgi:hypothetical protein
MSTIDEMRKQADAAFSLEVHSTQIGNELIRAADRNAHERRSARREVRRRC